MAAVVAVVFVSLHLGKHYLVVEKIRTQAGPQLPANVTAPAPMPDPNFAGPVPVAT